MSRFDDTEAHISLPNGSWVKFIGVDLSVTPEQIQFMIEDRTGVNVPLDRIQVTPWKHGMNAVVSLGGEHLTGILNWAFGEDKLAERPVKVLTVRSKR